MNSYEEILSAMEAHYQELTGFPADSASDIGIRLRVLAREVVGLYDDLATTRQQVFPQTATGQYLDYHAEARGIYRKKAQPATGTLRFSREIPATVDIPIHPGVVSATRPDPQVQFETIQGEILPAGQTSVDVPARAVEPGELGNAAPGAVCIMVAPAAGITAVTNPGSFGGGVDRENDDALRQRLLTGYRNISNGANPAYYREVALSYDTVAGVNVIPRARGRGTVDVIISCYSRGQELSTLAGLREQLERSREINVDLRVDIAAPKLVSLSAMIQEKESYDSAKVRAACTQALVEYTTTLQVGEPLLLARLSGVLLGVEGVYNCKITAPNQDISPAGDEIIRFGALSVTRMVVN